MDDCPGQVEAFGMGRQHRLDKVEQLAADGRRVLTKAELDGAGVSRQERRSQISADRWRSLPNGGVVLDHGPLAGEDAWREALVTVGDGARLGGTTALEAEGLTGLVDEGLHLWVEKSDRKGKWRRREGLVVHESRRWNADDVVTGRDLPRSSPDVAAVQAALWARSLRQASLFLVMPVQQRMVRPEDLMGVMARVQRHRFRRPLIHVLTDIAAGSHSLNELDFIAFCRKAGLPEPSRQTVRLGRDGRRYIDVEWRQYGVKAEIQGAGHGQLLQSLADDVRLIDLACESGAAVGISVLSLRVNPDEVVAALARLLAAHGWAAA